MRINPLVRSDSYKISHHKMYPENLTKMMDYIEARSGGRWNEAVFFGLQIFIKNTLMTPFTKEDIDEAAEFYNGHFLPQYKDQVFNREMFEYILEKYDGYMPVRIKAVPEGTVVPNNNVLCTIESTDERCSTIVSFLETTMLRDVWYGTTVATNSYQMKKIIREYGLKTSDSLDWMVFALHDFGARGVSSGESAVTGGAGHLVNFMGSDTLEAVYGAQALYGVAEGLPGYSVTASEHSVMTSEGKEGEYNVVRRIFDKYALDGGIIACVNDTYDMEAHVRWVCENLKETILESGVRWVTRPDSGTPSVVVVKCLDILNEYFGSEVNSKGYRVLNPAVRVIQGDGIDAEEVNRVLSAVKSAGFSTENVLFGCGGGLLQKVDRDTLRFAMKACYLEVDGEGRAVYKQPATQTGDYNKASKAGDISLYKKHNGEFMTLTKYEAAWKGNMVAEEALVPVYENGKLLKDYTLDEVRANTCLW